MIDGDLRGFAHHAIHLMTKTTYANTNLPKHRLDLMCQAFIDVHDDPRRLVIMRLRQNGVSVEDIVDIIIPAIARSLGQRWADDEISFAEVSIGSARLQETVRALGSPTRAGHLGIGASIPDKPQADPAPRTGDEAEKRVLLIIPRSEHHSLGAFVCADQLRRMDYAVDIAVDQHLRDITNTVRQRRYAMIGITAAGRRALASARDLVQCIRINTVRATPIVLGGSILESRSDLRKLTGVDHVASDMASALALCGLESNGRNALLEVDANE
ncbi:PpaA, heme-binding protein SCHIC domain protein sensory protein, regulator for photosystem formation [Roseibacterium elongatum DSM 19469]|uniref:PpaA, heme-binding protein SCHIC domain protein sensory protein, regulator for photosystem formation n=2 Tax=Roseicyclus elongatus TaxID=159346 RepID=W8SLU0_9RHOB|nr:PpaA, heme-binding protein SCHIC domain protein sensory protein, regulator for photosystem formation [Roseibacterium elongatum DSM 19469]